MKQILFVVSFFSICAFNAQDSSLVHQQFYGKQETAMKILGGGSAINLVSSPFLIALGLCQEQRHPQHD